MRNDVQSGIMKHRLMRGLRSHIRRLLVKEKQKYRVAHAIGVNPTLFNQIEGNLPRMSIDRLLQVYLHCQVPVTIQLDGNGYATVVFPTMPDDQLGV